MRYRVTFRTSVKKDMWRVSPAMIPRIEFAIRALSDDPHPLGSLKLHTAEGNYYRIRVGAYRVVFEVAHEIRIVTIFRVGHRKDVYRNL